MSAFAPITALAQTPSPGADALVTLALDTVRLVDSDDAGKLWDRAPVFLKQTKTRDTFVDEIRKLRAPLGTVMTREWVNVSRFTYSENSTMPPPGMYATVDFDIKAGDGRVAREKLSFRQEPDGWLPLGYVASELLTQRAPRQTAR